MQLLNDASSAKEVRDALQRITVDDLKTINQTASEERPRDFDLRMVDVAMQLVKKWGVPGLKAASRTS